ncbi:MAG: hypothetical protein ACP5PS_06210 [Bacteroidales bacterium]
MFDEFTLDVDSSVLVRYGQQQGAKRGYNPRKPGPAASLPAACFCGRLQQGSQYG